MYIVNLVFTLLHLDVGMKRFNRSKSLFKVVIPVVQFDTKHNVSCERKKILWFWMTPSLEVLFISSCVHTVNEED